ncbi:uncharacterized protein EV422DRAFT_509167 [Fimicolochytrium jonesii]|uniref:uncharacterized protein n=1 Tax=Fimicolochytrium jonesii TaxID=1396493 RepID=UPI0022FE49B2|nr:uncharacterized protein EV422DRAFT_509167 [Fimicolochytrium jonesii]KAI8817127.1 hypothetical protein EV422DRAFT_509167 [Fimicolochytrium jonesii]
MTKHKGGNMFFVLADDYQAPTPVERKKKDPRDDLPRFPIELPEPQSCSGYTPPKMQQVYYRRKWDKRVTRAMFKEHGLAKHNAVKESPEDITTPYHIEMIMTGWPALQAYEYHMGKRDADAWRKTRRTILEQEVDTTCIGKLPVGTKLYIGGWHDEFLDEDYFIYNDVTVVKPDGTIHVLQYHTDDFPPTDCHTATLVGLDTIVLIGSLGYLGHRKQKAQVCVLNLNTMKCRTLNDTKGDDPGWIAKHTAELMEDGKILITVSVPKRVEMAKDCRPGRWTFDHLTASWTALPLSEKDIADIREYESNISSGEYDSELQTKKFLEKSTKREYDVDEMIRKCDILVRVKAIQDETETLAKERKELVLDYVSAAKQLKGSISTGQDCRQLHYHGTNFNNGRQHGRQYHHNPWNGHRHSNTGL